MRLLGSKKVIYKFSSTNKPAYTVSDGETVVVETKDAFSNLVRNEKISFEDLAMDLVNPATGPIGVEGIHAGETLCVSIERIRCGARGVVMCSPELGILSSDVRRSKTWIAQVTKNTAKFKDGLEIELNPHIGVIGVSPLKGEYPTFYPGDFGGNMDTVEAREGSKVYLPAFVDGGNLAMGDVHAAMGDGEVCGTGVEVSAEVTVRLSKTSGLELERPMIETPTSWLSFATARTLDSAAKIATADMVKFLMNTNGMAFEDAYMLASVAANLKVSQVVDPLMAAKMEISKRYL